MHSSTCARGACGKSPISASSAFVRSREASHGSSPEVGASSSVSSTTPAEIPRTVVAKESSRRS